MLPDNYTLTSGRAANPMRSPSPEIDSDCLSARDTPEGTPPSDVPLVKYVKWGIPPGDASVDAEGLRPIRRAVPREILPDSETMKLKKSFGGKKGRRHNSFEIGHSAERGNLTASDSELDDKSGWQASSRCSPMSVESNPEKPDVEPISALSDLYRYSCGLSDDASDHESARLNYEGQSMRGSKRDSKRPRRGCHTISKIAEAVQKGAARTSTDRTALKILGSRGLNSRTGTYDTQKSSGERGFIVSPLPSERQLRVANAARHSYGSDSESDDSVSVMESGYSDMMCGCHNASADIWARVENESPYSSCSELQPRFGWLKRSVGPFTALAGAFLVFYGSRVLKARRRKN